MSSLRPSLAHLGIFVVDLAAMERFYTSVFGLLVTDRGVGAVFRNELLFLTGTADQHHQLVLSTGREPGTSSTIMQLSFKVESLAALRDIRRLAREQGSTDEIALNHGNAWSVYFNDPEGNRIEVYLDTPFHTPQPCGDPLDLELTDAEILETTRRLIERLPGSMPRSDYVTQIGRQLT